MSRNEPDGQFVYVYLDPESGAVRYVGSGRHDRMYRHTGSFEIDLAKNESPFYRWLRENRDVAWVEHRHRVFGPVIKEEAIAYEQALIEENFETVLNVRAAGNGRELRPAARPPREPYGVRSDSGRLRQYRHERRKKFGGNVMAGRGISRDGGGWRVKVCVNGKMVRKMFRTYCEALQFRKSLE